MPQFSESGTWKILASAIDRAGNFQVSLLPEEIQVVSNPQDLSPPQLTGLNFTPVYIDTSSSSQQVELNLNMTDDRSGVFSGSEAGGIAGSEEAGTWVNVRSPSGSQNLWKYLGPVAGSPLNGTWRANFTFNQFSEAGTWQIAQIIARDRTKNDLSVETSALKAMGFPTELVVVKPSLVVDGTISDPVVGGVVQDEVFGAKAQVIIPGNVLVRPTTVAIDVFQDPLNIPTPAGFESNPSTRFVNIVLTPTPVYPLPDPGLTVVLPLVNPPMVPGTRLDLFRVESSTGTLTPALDSSGQPVVGQVDGSGLTATFAGIARLSTIVGLIPLSLSVEIDIKPGSDTNSINLGSRGTVPVAILSRTDFDPAMVDPKTVILAGAPTVLKKDGKPMASFEDVNRDGLLDLVVHVSTQDLKLGKTDTEATLDGLTYGGIRIKGKDSVKIVP